MGPQPSRGETAGGDFPCWSSWEAARRLGAPGYPGVERKPMLRSVEHLQGWVLQLICHIFTLIQYTTKPWFSHNLQHKVCKNVHMCGLIVVGMKSIIIQILSQPFIGTSSLHSLWILFCLSVFDNSLSKSSSWGNYSKNLPYKEDSEAQSVTKAALGGGHNTSNKKKKRSKALLWEKLNKWNAFIPRMKKKSAQSSWFDSGIKKCEIVFDHRVSSP